ncbi:MAG: hypothetical protein RL088_3569 [Verrucomicrobiota bacterium]|jgi:hypothetical protein
MREFSEYPTTRHVKHPISLQNTQNTKHMKKHIIALLCSLAITITGFAHSGVEKGPNGGRLLEFSKDETLHGEVTVKDGKFVIELLDKSHKAVALGEQTLTASGGPSGKAAKLAVEKKDGKFVIPVVKEGEWLIVQFKADSKAKSITARLQYDTGACDGCKKPEWLCECPPAKDAKK